MRKAKRFALVAAAVLLCIFAAAFASFPVYGAGEIGIAKARLLPPNADFVKADLKNGVIFELWTPLDTSVVYFGGSDDPTNESLEKLVLSDQNKGLKVPWGSEVGNRFEIPVKTTTTLYVRRYQSETDEKLNYIETEVFEEEIYFKSRLDGVAPKLTKNSLRTQLLSNVWDISFSVEEPTSDNQYFWAQSGIQSIKIVQKLRPAAGEESYVPVSDPDGNALAAEFDGAGEGKSPVKRAEFSGRMNNERGDYYIELRDQVGNFARVSLLYISESSEQYFGAISKASEYASDENLNFGIRESVSNALSGFLAVLNEGATGDNFDAAYRTFLAAMNKANAAYEKGVNAFVTVENEEYLRGGILDAEFSAKNYAGKIMIGDVLELRIAVAQFDPLNSFQIAIGEESYSNAPNATGLLRFRAALYLNGESVKIGTPVKIYLGLPAGYRNLVLHYQAEGSNPVTAELQSGERWAIFTISAAGDYSLYYNAQNGASPYLWLLLLLLLPVGGAVIFIVIYRRKKSARSAITPFEPKPETFAPSDETSQGNILNQNNREPKTDSQDNPKNSDPIVEKASVNVNPNEKNAHNTSKQKSARKPKNKKKR